MTSPTLERAARAACVEMFGSDGVYATKDGVEKPMWTKCLPVARAVLMSVREPTHDMTAPVVPWGADRTPAITVWQAMIDAILNEDQVDG